VRLARTPSLLIQSDSDEVLGPHKPVETLNEAAANATQEIQSYERRVNP